MPRPLLPWFLGLGLNQTLRQILQNQQEMLLLLRHGHLSAEDKAVLERSISRLESLAKEH